MAEGGGKPIDWSKIRLEYITGNTSYRRLAEKYGVSDSCVRERGSKEKWRAEREAWRTKTVSNAAQKASARVASAEADKLAKMRMAADAMSEVVEKVLMDTDQFRRHMITTGLGEGVTRTECRVEDKYDTRAIKDVTTAIRDLTTALRNLYSLPTVQEQSAMDIAEERLRMEKAKTHIDDEEDASGIIMMPQRIDGEEAGRGG